MMKTTSISSIVVSFGSRVLKRISPSGDFHAPAMIARPRTKRAFASSEPRIDVCATTISPARSAKTTMKSSGRFPSVDCSTPVIAGPKRAPTTSVPTPTVHASSASPTIPARNCATAFTPAWCMTPRTTVAANDAPIPIHVLMLGRGYRPRVADWETVRAIATPLPGTEESTSYGQPAFRVRKKLFAWVSPDDAAMGALATYVDEAEKEPPRRVRPGRLLLDAALRGLPHRADAARARRSGARARAGRGLLAPARAEDARRRLRRGARVGQVASRTNEAIAAVNAFRLDSHA